MWPTQAPTQAAATQLAAIYLEALSDFSDGDMRIAVREAVRTCTHFPKPAELIAIIRPSAPELPPGDGGGPTTADLLRVQDLHRDMDAGQVRQLTGPPADPARVQAMIDAMLADQHDRAEKAKAWRNEGAQGETVMSGPRQRRQAKRKAALYEYRGKAEADSLMESIKATVPAPPYTDADRRKDRAWAEKVALQEQREQMMRERSERPAQGTGAAS